MTATLTALQQRYGGAIDETLRRVVADAGLPQQFAGMLQYQLGYVEADLSPSQRSGGKRFRPVLCALACAAVSGDPVPALRVAAGIELLHNFSLIHDDIEDGDPERRHRPTVWKVWGVPHATNAGDAMFALAGRTVATSGSDAGTGLTLTERFGEVSLLLTRGQYLDMSFERRHDVSRSEYLEMIELKTSVLVAYSLWAGAICGGASPAVREALWEFGMNLGRAFQIRDDVLGIWAERGLTGKEPGKDIRNRKKTLPVIMATERADSQQRAVLSASYERGGNDVDAVYRVLADTGVKSAAEAVVRQYRDAALADLSRTGLAAGAVSELSALATELTA